MRDRAKLTPFTQTTHSCILASYGVTLAQSANVTDVVDFFTDYCLHFAIAPTPTAEDAYVSDFQRRIITTAGFSIIEGLHTSSSSSSFSSARTVASVRHLRSVGPREAIGIEFMLEHFGAVACLAVGGGTHAVVVGVDATGRWLADTSAVPGWRITERPTVDQIPQLADALIVLFAHP